MTMSKIIRTVVVGIAVAGFALFNLLSASKSHASIHRRLSFFNPTANRNLKTVTTLSGTTVEIDDEQPTDNEEPQVQVNDEPATDNKEQKRPCLPRGRRRLGMFNPNVDVSTLQPCEEEEKKNDEVSQTTNDETTAMTVTVEDYNAAPRNTVDYIRSQNGFVEKAEEKQLVEESSVTVEVKTKQETTSEEETDTTGEVQQQPEEPKEQQEPSLYQGMMDYWTEMSYELSGKTTIVGLDTIATAAENLEAKKKVQEEKNSKGEQESTVTVVKDNTGEQESAATEEDNKSSQAAAAAIVEEDNSNGEFASDHEAATALEFELEDIANKGAQMIADIYEKYGVPTTRRR